MIDVKDALVKLVADKLGLDGNQIKLDSRLIKDLGANSLDIIELVVDIEDKFKIEIPEEEIDGNQTVADWAEYIKSKKAA